MGLRFHRHIVPWKPCIDPVHGTVDQRRKHLDRVFSGIIAFLGIHQPNKSGRRQQYVRPSVTQDLTAAGDVRSNSIASAGAAVGDNPCCAAVCFGRFRSLITAHNRNQDRGELGNKLSDLFVMIVSERLVVSRPAPRKSIKADRLATVHGKLGQLADEDPRAGGVRGTDNLIECPGMLRISIAPCGIAFFLWRIKILLEKHTTKWKHGHDRPVITPFECRLCRNEIGAKGCAREQNLWGPGKSLIEVLEQSSKAMDQRSRNFRIRLRAFSTKKSFSGNADEHRKALQRRSIRNKVMLGRERLRPRSIG